jgi:hypothetical protein
MNTYAEEYAEYAHWMAEIERKENLLCDHCDGFGDHGLDEDGKLYICYGCGGTGRAHFG